MSQNEKNYLCIRIKTCSSLSIGSGENRTTDSDILRDSRGIPFIPGTAVAGMTRHLLLDRGYTDEKRDRQYFGYIGTPGSSEAGENGESHLQFYDAFPEQKREFLSVTVRDQVSLDDYKVSKDGAKFDMEVLEPGVIFDVLISQNREDGDEDCLDKIADAWQSAGIFFGRKTTRGYGAFEILRISKAIFDFTRKEDILRWLTFHPDDATESAWTIWEK